jgi:hypothetical protein
MQNLASHANPRTRSNSKPNLKGKLGIVIVDMQDELLLNFTYRHGHPYRDGVQRVEQVVRLANSLGTPIIFLEYEKEVWGETIPELKNAAGGKGIIIEKPNCYGFDSPELKGKIRTKRIDTVLIAGFNRIACVLRTIEGAVELGLKVMTSDQLLFGNRLYDDEDKIRTCITELRRITTYFETAEQLMETIRLQSLVACQATSLQIQHC